VSEGRNRSPVIDYSFHHLSVDRYMRIYGHLTVKRHEKYWRGMRLLQPMTKCRGCHIWNGRVECLTSVIFRSSSMLFQRHRFANCGCLVFSESIKSQIWGNWGIWEEGHRVNQKTGRSLWRTSFGYLRSVSWLFSAVGDILFVNYIMVKPRDKGQHVKPRALYDAAHQMMICVWPLNLLLWSPVYSANKLRKSCGDRQGGLGGSNLKLCTGLYNEAQSVW
jgi:hypothetical protein